MRNEVEGSGLGDHGPSEQGLPWGSCLYRTFVVLVLWRLLRWQRGNKGRSQCQVSLNLGSRDRLLR